MKDIKLKQLKGLFAACKLPPQPVNEEADAKLVFPWDLVSGEFVSISRTPDEISVVCQEAAVPDSALVSEPGWSCLRVVGTMDFSLVGVVSGITTPLAAAGIGVFVVSTFDTDYLLIKNQEFERAVNELRKAGYEVDA